MSDLRTAAQQALEALQDFKRRGHWGDFDNLTGTLQAALVEDAMQKFTDVNQELEAALAEPENWELRRLREELERCKQVCAATSEAWREEAALGCDHCNQPLYAATKCRVCGRVTEPVQDTGVKLKPVFYAPRRLDDAEVEDIIKRNAAITESILNINFKEPQPGMVNLDAFHVFHFNDPPKGGFVGEIEMLKWLVRNRDGDYWKAKHGVQEPPCATRECMPSECPNCASLQDQNTELDRKLAEMEQTSLELCETCGWRTLIPGDCCLNCVRQQPKA